MSILNKIGNKGNTGDSDELREKLKQCTSLGEMIAYIQSEYDLNAVKPGILDKPFIIDGLVKIYNNFKPPRK